MLGPLRLQPCSHLATSPAFCGRPFFSVGDGNASFSGRGGPGPGERRTDNSWIGAVTSGDFFMGPLSKLEDEAPRYIGWTRKGEGFASLHGHPNNGTKFFTWGQNGGGRFMQDFLGGISGTEPVENRVGDYSEYQTGPAFSQMQTFDIPEAGKSWTEFFTAIDGDPALLASEDYDQTLDHVEEERRRVVPSAAFEDVDAFFRTIVDAPIEKIVAEGMPWGGLEELRRAHADPSAAAPMVPGLRFSVSRDDSEAGPWVELVEDGVFSSATLARTPLSYQVGDEWLALLRASASTHGSTWLHDLHVGIALAERGQVEEPARLFNRSFVARPSAVAARCLAVLASSPAEAWPRFQTAWVTAVSNADEPARSRLLANLATEISNFLLGERMFTELASASCSRQASSAVWPALTRQARGPTRRRASSGRCLSARSPR